MKIVNNGQNEVGEKPKPFSYKDIIDSKIRNSALAWRTLSSLGKRGIRRKPGEVRAFVHDKG